MYRNYFDCIKADAFQCEYYIISIIRLRIYDYKFMGSAL
jgi:hypothetical protein